MPVLDDLRTKNKHTLPSSGIDVEIWSEMTAAEAMSGMQIDTITGAIQNINTMQMIAGIIASWNATDRDGNVLDVTVENVGKLPLGDFTYLSEKMADVVDGSSVSNSQKKST